MKARVVRILAFTLLGALFVVRGLVACSSDETKSEGGTDASTRDPNANCVKPGTKNNEQGIGGYCESNADCVPGKSLCTNFSPTAPPNAWFCTRLCRSEPNCGEGLYCAEDPRGTACVPIVCGVADSGTDATVDAALDADAETDAGVDAADAGLDAAVDAPDGD